MKKIITAVIIILAATGIGFGGFMYYRHHQTTMNNESAVGNTSGNLINGVFSANMMAKYILPTLMTITNYTL